MTNSLSRMWKGKNISVRRGADDGWWTVDRVEGGRVYLRRDRDGLKETAVMAFERIDRVEGENS